MWTNEPQGPSSTREGTGAYWVWDLPFGVGRRWAAEGVAGVLLGGWQVNGVMSIMSGTPINPNFANPGGDISNAVTFGFITSTTATVERNLSFGARLSF